MDLARFLRQHRDDIIQIWRERVLSDPSVPEANRLATPALVDHVPALIERVIGSLEKGTAGRVDAEQIGRAAGRGSESEAHAKDRLAAQYELPSAMREVSHLRAAVLEVCARERALVASEQSLVVNAELDEVMVLAAVRLHDARQGELRASEERLQAALAREEAMRRAAEQNELELRRLSQMGMLGVIVGTRDGALIEANDAFLKMVGFERRDLAAGRLRWREMTPAQYRHLDDRAIRQLAETGVAPPYEKAYLRRDGTLVHVLIGTATLDPAQQTDVAFVLDISATTEAEAAFARASQERDATLATLETFMASAPVGFAVVDRELRYLRINDTLAGMNGVPAADHIGRRVPEIIPQFAEQAEALLRRVLDSREPVTGLHVEVPADGTPRHLLASYYPLPGPDGNIHAVGAVVVDITEQKHAEQELRKDADLRERFMAVLGHDLRSPLSAILLGTQALLRNENVPPGYIRALQRIKNSARRADRLVGDLVDLVRTRQGTGIPVLPQPVDLKDVCEDVIAEVNATYADRRIELVRQGGCEGRWDPDRIAQLIANLLTNAVIYSPPDTTVTIEVGRRDARSVFLRVHNQGPPIPANLIPCLFDPFRRGHDETTDQTRRGLGLGLHIAQQIARAHAGQIQVDSSAEAGTTFTVTLPRDLRSDDQTHPS